MKEFDIEDLVKISERINSLADKDRENFCAEVFNSRKVWEPLIKACIWKQYELLGEFNENLRFNDIARGGINALDVLLDFLQDYAAEYERSLGEHGDKFDEHKPIGE